MKLNNKHRGLVLSSTFVGLVCGLVLTHQQAYAAQTPPVSNQESQIKAVSDNNLNQTATVNSESYSSNISYPTSVIHNVTPNTYSSPETTSAAKQQIASSDSTAAVATTNTDTTVPVANETANSTNPGNNNSTNTITDSYSSDTINSATTPTASDDNQTNGNSNTTSVSSEQSDTNIITQGTWGTSKWDYTQKGKDYILHLYAGTLGTPGYEGIGSLNAAFEQQLTQIVIDPGVIANQNSSGLFSNLKNLQTIQGLENLDISQVTNMSRMFEYCEGLTKLDLGSWNTSNVENVRFMLNGCINLLELNLKNWSTLKVSYDGLYAMLNECKSLSKLVLGPETILTSVLLPDVPEVGTKVPGTDKTVTASCWVATSGYHTGQLYTSEELMTMQNRYDTTTYEWSVQPIQPIFLMQGTWGTSKWDYTQKGKDYILHLYAGTLGTPGYEGIGSLNAAFEQQLTQIVIDPGVIANQNSSGLFSNLKNLQTIQGLENLDISQVTNMSRMFEYCEGLTKLDLGSWNTSNVENMSWMFNECTNLLELNLKNWSTLKATYNGHYAMLNHCNSLSKLVLGPETILTGAVLPDVPEVGTKIPGTNKTVKDSRWIVTGGYHTGQRYTSEDLMAIYGRDQTTTYEWAIHPISSIQGTWGTSKWDYIQKGAEFILYLHAGTLGTPGYEGIGSLNKNFEKELTKIVIDPGVIANQNSKELFSGLFNLKTIQGLENLDTSQVTDMSGIFDSCESLTSVDLSNFDTTQVITMKNMFFNCESLTSVDLSNFDTTQVTTMENMFFNCESLTSVDLSNFNTSQVIDMHGMFQYCKSLVNLDVSHFNTSKVTDMFEMFYGCQSLVKLDVSHFDTSQVNGMSEMFSNCKNLTSLDLSSFDTSQIFNQYSYFAMLAGCTNLNHLVLGIKTQLIDQNGRDSELPAVPAAGTKIPGTDKIVKAPYWVATSGYQRGKRYTSVELERLTGRDQVTIYDWVS